MSPEVYKYDGDGEWISGAQTVPISTGDQASGLIGLAFSVGAVAGAGYIPIGPNERIWDLYVKGLRYMEEYSPGRILRTFQLGHILSPFEAASLEYRYFSPSDLAKLHSSGPHGARWIEHIAQLAGVDSIDEILERGFRHEGGSLYFGQTGDDILLRYASITRSPTGSMPQKQAGFMRSLRGGPIADVPPGISHAGPEFETEFSKRVLTQRIPYQTASGQRAREQLFIEGGQTRFQQTRRTVFGLGTTGIERLNQLAKSPFEIDPFKTIFEKVPFLRDVRLGVTSSSGLKTLGKLTAKLGIGTYAAYLAYKQLDWLVREAPIFDQTIFAEGTSVAAGTVWTKSQLAISSLAEATGGHDIREAQEDVAPGSTSLSRLLAFPLLGALGGLGVGYGQRLYQQAQMQRQGLSFGQAAVASSLEERFFKEAIYGEKVGANFLAGAEPDTIKLLRDQARTAMDSPLGKIAGGIADRQVRSGPLAFMSRMLGKIGPTKLKMLAGAALGAIPIIPFLPGALAPGTRPDELERIYSGEQQVAVRKGRWWELSRQPFQGTGISRYKKHWYQEMLHRPKEKAIWGEDAPSPMERWFIENFTYDLELEHFYERPYPISGQAFSETPILGTLLGATIGQVVKPAREMHTYAWRNEETGEVRRMPLKYGERMEIPELGEVEPGEPISPYGIKSVISEQWYRVVTEATGLWGFGGSQVLKGAIGTEEPFSQEQRLQTAGEIYSPAREFWDMELGGGAFTTEAIRRLYPAERKSIPTYNPIPNMFTDVGWLPGSGEKSPDFKHGDPFCVSEDTFLEIDNCKLAKAEEVYDNPKPIKTHLGSLSDINTAIIRPRLQDEKVFDIKVNTLSAFSFTFSENHPILVSIAPPNELDGKVQEQVIYSLNIVLSSIREGHITAQTICLDTKLHIAQVRKILKYLVTSGKITRFGAGKKYIKNIDCSPFQEPFVEWKFAQEVEEGDYVAYPLPRLQNKKHVIDLAKYCRCHTGKQYIWYGRKTNIGPILEWLGERESIPNFAWGKRRDFLAQKGWAAQDYESACKSVKYSNKKTLYIKRFISSSPEVMRFLGLWIAEGWASKDGNIGLAGHIKEIETFRSIVQKAFPFIKKITIKYIKDTNGMQIYFSSFAIANFLLREFKKGAHNKEIPKWVFQLDKTSIESFCDGYLLGDGSEFNHCGTKFRKSYKSCNLQLLYQTRMLLLTVGIVGKLIKDVPPKAKPSINGKTINSGLAYFLNIDTTSANDWGSDKDINKGYKCLYYIGEKYLYLRVQKKEVSKYKGKLYGFSVPGHNSFCVAGFATHNTKIIAGESRLPGAGYASYHPELKGVAPQDYPSIHRYNILADVAPYTYKLNQAEAAVRREIAGGRLNKEQIAWFQQIRRQVQSKKKKKEFFEYQHKDRALTSWSEKLEPVRETSLYGRFWEMLSHSAETPLEQLTPVSPASKLVHMRTAVEDYERTQAFGTSRSFWGHPMRDFLKPFVSLTARELGSTSVPSEMQQQRNVEEYFDILKYVKYQRLGRIAQEQGDHRAARRMFAKTDESLVGLDPFSFNFSHIYRSLPRRDRDYFRSFSETRDMEERSKILGMIPDNEKALYLAKWQSSDVQDIKRAIKKGLLSEEEIAESQKIVDNYSSRVATEGFPIDDRLMQEYVQTRFQGEDYPDWYRRVKLIPERIEQLGMSLPGPDWVSWHPQVELDTVKLKVVEDLGASTFDYDIWPDTIRAATHRPYLEQAAEDLYEPQSSEEIRSVMNSLMTGAGITNPHVVVTPNNLDINRVDIRFREDRSIEARTILENEE